MNTKKFSAAMSEIDDKYVEEAILYTPNAKTNPRFHHRLSAALIAAILALLLISAAAVATSVFGTRLVALFTSRTEPGSDYSESGFDLSVAIEKIPIKDLMGEIHEVGNIIKQQFKEYKLYNSWYPGHWQGEFESRDKACDYIGFDLLKRLDWDLEEQRTMLSVVGNKKGEMLSVNLETDYRTEDIRLQFFSTIYTENYDDELTIGSRTTENVEFVESFYTTDNNKQCHMIDSSALESGYMGMDGYMVDNGVLYNLHVAHKEKDSTQAKDLMYQWANLF